MSLTERVDEVVGIDKLLHLAFGGWIVSMVSPLGWVAMLIVTILLFGISMYKEYKLDNVVDPCDVVFAMIGSGISWVAYWILIPLL